MEVTDIEAIPVAVPLKPVTEDHGLAPYLTGTPGATESAARTMVKLETDEGTTGWGEMMTALSPSSTKAIVETDVAEAVVGKSVWEVESFHEDFSPSLYLEADSFASGVEMAMWDAYGKHLDVPVHQLLGGKTTDTVDFAYCLGILDVEQSVRRVEQVRDAGFGALKTKVGGYDLDTDPDGTTFERSRRFDVDRLVAMAEAAGDAVELRADANQSWRIEDAVRVGAQLEDAGVYLQYFEQPIRRDSVGSYKRLRNRLRQPIGVNEDLYFEHSFYELVREDAVDVGVIDMVPAGGIVPMKKLAAVAEEAGVSLAHHCGFDLGVKTAAMLHAISTTPAIDLPSDTTYYAFADHVIDEPFEFEDGALPVPDAPGLGITVDEAKVDELRVA
jgi:L-alanine-DL-glutamate epimerase-like enolase superfamily enzyme